MLHIDIQACVGCIKLHTKNHSAHIQRAMIRNILLIVLGVALVVTGFHFFHESRRKGNTPPPQSVSDILPQELKSVYQKQQLAAANTTPATSTPDQPATPGELTPRFESNGIDSLHIHLVNSGATSAEFLLEAGTVLQSAANLIMTAEDMRREVAAGETVEASLRVVPLRSSNSVQKLPYRKVQTPDPQWAPIAHLVRSNAATADAKVLRTAALLMAENPSLERIAAFPTIGSDLLGEPAAKPLLATAQELLEALVLLKSHGADLNAIDLASDPQLQLETLVKPATNALARKFYGLEGDRQHWAFWRDTIINGDPRLKHYALYGIGRFYPDVAATMMPAWASDRRLLDAYRLSAVYALGLSATPEARKQLDLLAVKYPPQTDLGRAVQKAIAHMERHRGTQQ